MKTPSEILQFLRGTAKAAEHNTHESRANPRTIAESMKQSAELALEELENVERAEQDAKGEGTR